MSPGETKFSELEFLFHFYKLLVSVLLKITCLYSRTCVLMQLMYVFVDIHFKNWINFGALCQLILSFTAVNCECCPIKRIHMALQWYYKFVVFYIVRQQWDDCSTVCMYFRATANKEIKEKVQIELGFVKSKLEVLKGDLAELNSSIKTYQNEK